LVRSKVKKKFCRKRRKRKQKRKRNSKLIPFSRGEEGGREREMQGRGWGEWMNAVGCTRAFRSLFR
jgi:hypothetical protein